MDRPEYCGCYRPDCSECFPYKAPTNNEALDKMKELFRVIYDNTFKEQKSRIGPVDLVRYSVNIDGTVLVEVKIAEYERL